MGILDDLIETIDKPIEKPEDVLQKKEEEKKPEVKGQFAYSEEFEKYAKEDNAAVGSEDKGE